MRFLFGIFFSLLILGSCMNDKNSLDHLHNKLTERFAQEAGSFALAFRDVESGNEILINERETYHAASTMKTPVLLELYRQSAAGRFSLNDSIEIKNTFTSIADASPYSLNPADDSEQDLYNRLGEKESISSLAYKMIIRSSNLATNMLIELVSPDSVMQTMKMLGATDIQVRRGVEDTKAFEKGLNNTTTAYDLLLIFDALARGKAIDQSASDSMIDILLDQEFRDIIPARLPTGVKVAHKTGSITGIQHDSGIVILPDGRKYILVLLSRFEPETEKKAITAMADASEMIYNFMTGKKSKN